MNSKSKLNKVAIFNMLSLVVLNGLAFFTMPIFTRLLGTENYGYYTEYASYLSILTVLVGFQSAGAIAPASVVYEGKERDACFSNIMMAAIASMIVIGIPLFACLVPFSNFTGMSKTLIIVLFVHAAGQYFINFATGKFSYDKKPQVTFVISLTVSVVSIGLSLLFLYFLPETVAKYEGYILGHAIPSILIGFVMLAYFLLKGRSFVEKRYWKFALSLCLPLILHQFANVLLHQCDKIMLKQMTTESLVGIYGFSVTFSNIISLVWSALNTTWIPFYYDDAKMGAFDALKIKTRNYTTLYTCLNLGFIMAMPEVVKLFSGSDFWDSITVIPILSFGLYFVFLYSFPVNFEFYHQKTKIIAIGTVMASVLNIVLNAIFIPLFGMIGAAVATALSYVILWLFHLILSNFVIKEEYHFKNFNFTGYILVMLAGMLLFYLIKDLWYIRWSLFAGLAIYILVRVKKQGSIF